MIQDSKQNVYYLTKTGDECHIVEVSAQKSMHRRIFTVLSDSIYGLSSYDGSTFYILDAEKNVLKLKRASCGSKLTVVNQLSIKEKYRANLHLSPFENVILSDQFAIVQHKVYFLHDLGRGPLRDGLLDAETLADESSLNMKYEFSRGPFLINGSSQFLIEFKFLVEGQLPQNVSKVYHILDQSTKILVNDFNNEVNFSSYLQNGNIIVKSSQRFLIFNSKGDFITEANLVFR